MQTILENTDLDYNLSIDDIESVFNVHKDKLNNYVFNLNETTYFTIPESLLKSVILDHPLHWSAISYRLYETTRLAWFLIKLNNIDITKIFTRVAPGTTVYYVDADNIELLLNNIKSQIAIDNK